ncbi:MAG TPA: hypothetical protein VKR83_06825, partial [Ktedonobacteraceae bacterium]|nr:hypothetical protein [Ktedonobacteraceae bacterium]
RSQGGGKPRPYYIRLGVPSVYSRGDPRGRPGGGTRPISTILNLTPIGETLAVALVFKPFDGMLICIHVET